MKIVGAVCFFLFLFSSALADVYVWNGSVSSAWNIQANWTPATGIPGSADQVNINNALAPNPCALDMNRTVTSLFLTAGICDLGGFTLTTTSFSTTGGTLQNGFITTIDITNLRSTVFNGVVSINKTGGIANVLYGGNTFNGPFVLTNNDDNNITMAGIAGDRFLNTVEVNVTNSGRINLASAGVTNFSSNIKMNSSGSGGIVIGNVSAGSIQSGGALLTDGFSTGVLTLNKFTQLSTQTNGTFNPTTFTANNSILNGGIIISASGNITINGSSFKAANQFTGATNISLSNTCEFSNSSGSTTFIKNGGTINNWAGNITFGPAVIANNSASVLAVGNSTSSSFVYLNSITFNNTSSGRIQISNRGATTFTGDVTINNSGSGGIRFGETGGTTSLSAGALLTNGFTAGPLIFSNVTQSASVANGSFTPTTFTSRNTILNGNINVKTTSGTLSITSSRFTASNNFESAGNLLASGVNHFSTISGTTTLQKNGGTRTFWSGGNVFGNVMVINNSLTEWYLANAMPDDYNGNATFRQLSTGGLYPAFNGENTFSGDISTIGTLNIIYFALGNGRVVIDGSSTQTISGSSLFIPTTRRLSMRSGGLGDLQLATPLNILNDLTLTSGIIHTDAANILTLMDDSVTTSIGNAASFVDGPLQYNMDKNSLSRTTLNFPVGKQLDWRPLTLKLAHNSTTRYTYRAEVFNASARNLNYTLPPTVDTISDVHYWDVERYLTSSMVVSPFNNLITTPGSEPSITLTFDAGDLVYDGANLTIVKNTATSPTAWFDVGGISTAGAGNTPVSGSIESTSTPSAVNSFGRFTLGSMLNGFNPLPLVQISLSVQVINNNALIRWNSNESPNNLSFVIEKSNNGVDFSDLKTLLAHDALYSNQSYQFFDPSPSFGPSFYRIKQNKTGKTSAYSNIVSLFIKNELKNEMSIYPNPSMHNGVTLQFSLPLKNSIIKLTDEAGRLITIKKLGGGVQSVFLSEAASLPRGSYWIVVTNENQKTSLVKKLVVN